LKESLMSEISDEELRPIVQRVVAQMMGGGAPKPAEPAKTAATAAPAPLEALAAKPQPAPAAAGGRKVVALGADHGGYELKEALKKDVAALGYEVLDLGTNSKEAVDYPDFAHDVARAVAAGKAWRGIIIDGAGIGSCIVANKVPGVRAGMAYDNASAVNSREHNDTNVLTLGAGLIGQALAKQIVTTWLATEFGGGRHARRVNKIIMIERLYTKWVHLVDK
jgi:ribose 5-phosphate isomerase B